MSFTISPAAEAKILGLITTEKPMIRCGLRGGGCAGIEYDLTLTNHKDKFDSVLLDGKLVIDRKSEKILESATLDWVSTLMEKRFKITFSDNRKTCSCGTSFSL